MQREGSGHVPHEVALAPLAHLVEDDLAQPVDGGLISAIRRGVNPG